MLKDFFLVSALEAMFSGVELFGQIWSRTLLGTFVCTFYKFKRFCIYISLFSSGDQSRILVENHMYIIYTMHDKFSNCFVWMNPSTSDLKFHLLS